MYLCSVDIVNTVGRVRIDTYKSLAYREDCILCDWFLFTKDCQGKLPKN